MEQYKLPTNKPIRLIELFGGIGAQAKALERLSDQGKLTQGFTHYRMIDNDIPAVLSYNAIHGTGFVPSDITETTADDLGICDTDKYTYILTYTFPCTDISHQGLQKGMDKGSETRSALLWEVQRLLNETQELPQVLLMENVKQLLSKKHIANFSAWVKYLESKGYKNYYSILNSVNYGIAQDRERVFMVSLLGDYTYTYPKGKPLTTRLGDYLETDPSPKYELKPGMTNLIKNANFASMNYTLTLRQLDDIAHTITARYQGVPQVIITNGEPIESETVKLRQFTPKEVWRLMGFDDEDVERASMVNSDSQLYKQAGNSIVVNVLEAIFEQML